MVVEDDIDLLTVITSMLESKGYQVHGFTDPEKALAHVNECKECATVISDIRMPGMNGFQLVRALKKKRPDMRVILMTAFEIHKKEWQQTVLSTQVDQFIIKPFKTQELVEAIED
jgi:DNA-binding NtrC family response regulator